MIQQKAEEDDAELRKQFKANPVPASLSPERY
jgi:hypothetical protein